MLIHIQGNHLCSEEHMHLLSLPDVEEFEDFEETTVGFAKTLLRLHQSSSKPPYRLWANRKGQTTNFDTPVFILSNSCFPKRAPNPFRFAKIGRVGD
jgi:hypothetical protein